MDIGRELRVIEVEEPTVEPVEMEPVEMEPVEVEEPARSWQAEPGHTDG